MHVVENLYFNMVNETTTYTLCEKLQVVCEKMSSSSRFILIQQSFNMKMKETFSRVPTELSSQGLNFEEESNALALVSSLPSSSEVFCTMITNNSTKLMLQEAIG